MKNFLKENKFFLAVVISSLIIGGAIYFSLSKTNNRVDGEDNFPKNKKGECSEIPNLPNGAEKLVTKVIDGDTFIIEGGYSVRILSIDADERGYPCYQEAKDKLEELILNKKVKLEIGTEDVDQYCRYLRYVFQGNENIGLELIKEGLAVARFYSDSKYQEEITKAEKEARENEIGCKWSASASSFAEATEDEESTKNKESDFQWKKLTSELTGLKIIDACKAKNYLGEEIIVQGEIVDTYRSKTNTVFLNFGNIYPKHCFVAVIFNSYQNKFAKKAEKYYADKMVRIKGKISEYKGKPQIILKNANQIEIGE